MPRRRALPARAAGLDRGPDPPQLASRGERRRLDRRDAAILAVFRAEHGPDRVEIREGPRQGFAANYLGLAGDPGIRADYYAFADQDDVWLPDRLARGLARVRAAPAGRPALYGGRTILIDEAGRETGRSLRFHAAPGFANALVQSIAGGNTMLFDGATKRLLETVRPATVVAHDWWITSW